MVSTTGGQNSSTLGWPAQRIDLNEPERTLQRSEVMSAILTGTRGGIDHRAIFAMGLTLLNSHVVVVHLGAGPDANYVPTGTDRMPTIEPVGYRVLTKQLNDIFILATTAGT